MIRTFRGTTPSIAVSAYVDPSAVIIGDVTIGDRSSIWPHVTIRGDLDHIAIGSETNIQDGTVLHCDAGVPLSIAAGRAIADQLYLVRFWDPQAIGLASLTLALAALLAAVIPAIKAAGISPMNALRAN